MCFLLYEKNIDEKYWEMPLDGTKRNEGNWSPVRSIALQTQLFTDFYHLSISSFSIRGFGMAICQASSMEQHPIVAARCIGDAFHIKIQWGLASTDPPLLPDSSWLARHMKTAENSQNTHSANQEQLSIASGQGQHPLRHHQDQALYKRAQKCSPQGRDSFSQGHPWLLFHQAALSFTGPCRAFLITCFWKMRKGISSASLRPRHVSLNFLQALLYLTMAHFSRSIGFFPYQEPSTPNMNRWRIISTQIILTPSVILCFTYKAFFVSQSALDIGEC